MNSPGPASRGGHRTMLIPAAIKGVAFSRERFQPVT
jgi:hypothetical protein